MKKNIIARIFLNSFLTIILLSSVVLVPSYAFAQPATTPAPTTGPVVMSITLQNPLGTTSTLPAFITSVMKGIVQLLTPVIVIMFLWTGFLFVKAQGKAEELTAAKKSLTYTIIGAALVLGASGFALILQATFTNL